MVGEIVFDTNKSGIFGDIISSDGRAVWDVPVDAGPSGQFGPAAISRYDATEVTLTPTAAMQARGVDTLSGYSFLHLGAPAGATSLSPVTTLLRSLDDDAVAANTGLGLSARELATFAAVPAMSNSDAATAALGRRVTAYNLKLTALAALSQPSTEAILTDSGFRFDTLRTVLEGSFRSGRVDLNSASTIRALMDQMPYISRYATSDGKQAAAALLARYGAAVDTYLTDPRRASSVQHGYRLVVLPTILDVILGRSPVADAEAITTDILVAAFHEFAEIQAPAIETRPYVRNTIMHSLVAVTDLREISRIAGSDTLTLRADCSLGAGGNSPPHCNDVGIASVGTINLDRTELRLGAVRVPDKFAGRLSVSLAPSGEITIRRLNGTIGLVWFEYDLVHSSGLKATGRTYVRLGPSG